MEYISNACQGYYKSKLPCRSARRAEFNTCKRHAAQEADIVAAHLREKEEAVIRAAQETVQRETGIRIIICDGKTATYEDACTVFRVDAIKGTILYPGAPYIHYGCRVFDHWDNKTLLCISTTPAGAEGQAWCHMRNKEMMAIRAELS
jgi:hypothetical protein